MSREAWRRKMFYRTFDVPITIICLTIAIDAEVFVEESHFQELNSQHPKANRPRLWQYGAVRLQNTNYVL